MHQCINDVLISLHRQQTMSPGEMEIQLSSMSQQECTYQAIVTVVILVSMIHNLYSHVHVFVSHGTVYIHSYCRMSCQCDILNNLISSLLEMIKSTLEMVYSLTARTLRCSIPTSVTVLGILMAVVN